MNNPDPTLASYSRYREALSKACQWNKAVVFDALVAAEITQVHIEFDGWSDSGQIECVTAYRGEQGAELPTVVITLQRASWSQAEPGTMDEPLPQALETLCYDYLEETHDGWEINDGAFGEFRLDVAARTVELEFNGRYTEVSTENHTF